MPNFKASKSRLILLLGVNAVSDFKWKPLFLCCFENPRALKSYTKASSNPGWQNTYLQHGSLNI